MKTRRSYVLAVVAILASLSLAACGGNKTAASKNSSNASGGGAAMTAPLQDGTYLATYKYLDAHGWQEFLEMTVKGGKVTAATFNAVDANAKLKTNNQQYNTQMKQIAGTNPQEYTKKLEDAFLAKQATPVDVVTGATESSHDFNTLADKLLAAAKSGDTQPIILPQNATYTAELATDTHGWTPHLEVTFENGQITKVYFDGVQKTNGKITARKSQDASFQKQYTDATKNNVNDVFSKLQSELLQTGDPAKVDAVSGATQFSSDFKTLAQEILQKQRISISPDKIKSAIGS